MKKSKKQSQIATLSDKALALLRNGKHRAALESFTTLEELEPEQPEWSRRAAECHRGLDDRRGQIEALGRAAERYVTQGALAKAIAMSRMILNLDPHHARTQKRLLELQGGPGALDAPPLPPAPKVLEPASRHRAAAPLPEKPEPPPVVKADAPPRPSLEQVLRQRRAASRERRPPAEAPREPEVAEREPIVAPIPEPMPVAEPEPVVAPEPIAASADDLGPEPEVVPEELEIRSMPAPKPSVPAALPSTPAAASPTPVPPSDEAVTLRPPRFAADQEATESR